VSGSVPRMVKEALPPPAKSMARWARVRFNRLMNLGNAVECPCCGYKGRQFLTFGVIPRPNARCPACRSVERHRLLWLYLKRETDIFHAPLKVLHFAPEPQLHHTLSQQRNLVQYVTADIEIGRADVQVDIRRIDFPSATFDVVLCSHVLEHVDEDRQAMSEILRVLKPEGFAILMVPFAPAQAISLEDPAANTPEARMKLYGNPGHLRIYGRDFVERLEGAGFAVEECNFAELLPVEDRTRYCLTTDAKNRTMSGYVHEDVIFRCVRPVPTQGVV
jgi:SAM-dependent methyltransferase